MTVKTLKRIGKPKLRKAERTKVEYKNRIELIDELFKTKSAEVMRGIKKISLKAKVKIKKGIYNNIPPNTRSQFFRITDHIHERNDGRVCRTLDKHSEKFKNLYAVYVVLGNGEVIGWGNYWKDRKNFNNEWDQFVFIHVKKQYRGNGIGRKIFKEIYRSLLKGKKGKRKYFIPNPYNSEFKSLNHPDFFDKMIKLAVKGKL